MRIKKCRYYNRGYCKYKSKCRYTHPKHICKEYMASQKCEKVDCYDRHPKVCKWADGKTCQRHDKCKYMHVTVADKEKSLTILNVHHVNKLGRT